MTRLFRLKPRTRRWFEGAFYLGCYAPVAFSAIAIMIVIKALADRLRPQA